MKHFKKFKNIEEFNKNDIIYPMLAYVEDSKESFTATPNIVYNLDNISASQSKFTVYKLNNSGISGNIFDYFIVNGEDISKNIVNDGYSITLDYDLKSIGDSSQNINKKLYCFIKPSSNNNVFYLSNPVNESYIENVSLTHLLNGNKKIIYGFKDINPTCFNNFGKTLTDASEMFKNCSGITEMSQFDTSNVTSMNAMFYGCSALTSMPLIDTRNVENMGWMFWGCANLKKVHKMDTSKVTDMYAIFSRCYSLTEIPLIDTSNISDMNSFFYRCSSLKSIPKINTSRVTSMYAMFDNSAIEYLPQLDTHNVINMVYTFNDCGSLKEIPLLDATNVDNMSMAFRKCFKLSKLGGFKGLKTSIDLSDSEKLTHNSIMNVINEAADVKTSSKEMYLGIINLEKLTESEKKIATDKGWILR